MRRFVLTVLMVLVVLPAVADEGDRLLGFWMTDPEDEGGAAKVEIVKKDGLYSGKIIWLAEPVYGEDEDPQWRGKAKVDRENPDENLKKQPVIGLQIVEGFHYAGKDRWEGGTIYDPNNGKTYRCWMKLKGDTLKVRGYIGFSLLGRTTYWTRVEEKK